MSLGQGSAQKARFGWGTNPETPALPRIAPSPRSPPPKIVPPKIAPLAPASPPPPPRPAVPPPPVSSTPGLAGRRLPSPFSLADTARGWVPTGSCGSIRAADSKTQPNDHRPGPRVANATRFHAGHPKPERGDGRREPRAWPERERAAPGAAASFPGRRRVRPL